jgi:PAS domain S-box-containing protein
MPEPAAETPMSLWLDAQLQREQQTRLQALVMNNMAEGVVLVSAASGSILHANPRFEHMLGYASGQLAGLPIAVINARSDRDPVAVADAIISELRQHGQWRGEVKNCCADGREIWTSCTVSELHFEGLGAVWVAVHSDINDKRLAQDARAAALEQLRRLTLNVQDSIEAERL